MRSFLWEILLQVKNWWIDLKNIEFLDIKDMPDSTIVEKIMEAKKIETSNNTIKKLKEETDIIRKIKEEADIIKKEKLKIKAESQKRTL